MKDESVCLLLSQDCTKKVAEKEFTEQTDRPAFIPMPILTGRARFVKISPIAIPE